MAAETKKSTTPPAAAPENADIRPSDAVFRAMHAIRQSATPHTARAYERHINAFAEFLDENEIQSFDEVAHTTVSRFLSKYAKGASTYNQALAAIRKALDWCDMYVCPIPHLLKIERRVKSARTPKDPQRLFMSRAEIRKASDAIAIVFDRPAIRERNRLLFDLAVATLLRCEELSNIRLGDLDIEASTIAIRGKGGAVVETHHVTDVIPVARGMMRRITDYIDKWRHPSSAEDLRARSNRLDRTPDAPLFTSQNGEQLSTSSINRIFSMAITHIYPDNAPPRNHAVHAVRRSVATIMLKEGTPLPTIQKMLRHANIETTMRYLSVDAKDVRDAFEKAGLVLGGM